MKQRGIFITGTDTGVGKTAAAMVLGVLLKQKGVDVFDLRRASANRKEFEGRVKKLQPRLVILNGHGNERTVAGHDNEPLVQIDDNEELLYGRITYALSCNSAAELGVHCAQHSRTTYIGYTDKFIFSLTRNTSSRPLEDSRARPFMESSNQVALALLKGHTAAEASQKSKELFKKNYSNSPTYEHLRSSISLSVFFYKSLCVFSSA